uniref:centrosomal protein of 104 kDa isoform X1 n=1 Tax=Ciona intestinalis TaxID=7719 RepID=UPI00089DD2DA|nr:centrosomal protein of 104 kDa isoform X1 [Ciona intestinalis]|eukprot:XP_018668059.1 centrosomal protein of 104 kDa isoform X1 [Ciona intestinalis]
MPSKIGYSVVGSTGEAEGYGAKNLEHQNPTIPGWQTPRFCVYPQELIIRMNERTNVKKLQLLAHQFMIPSKIEFFVGTNESADSFKRLGYIYLSNNEKTGFKARELKSVHVDADGHFLRLVVHKNHMNKFNLYNQVGIMAFNVIGDGISKRHPLKPISSGTTNPLNYSIEGSINKPDYISPMDDLAFDMYQDPEVAGIIRKLDVKKQKAVIAENFDVAKRMKQAIADLQKVGEKLARYELDKRRAVEHEDYDLAKSKKSQMDEYRLKVYQQLQKYNLLEDAGISPVKQNGEQPLQQVQEPQPSPRRVISEPIVSPRPQPSPPPMESPSLFVPHEEIASPRLEPPQEQIQEKVASPEPVATYSPRVRHSPAIYDEKVIPALVKHKDPDPFLEDEVPSPRQEFSPDKPSAPSGEPEAMSEKSIREASSVIDVFGLPLVSGAYSKTWSFREDALLAVYKLLSNAPETISKDELKSHLRAAIFLIRRAIKDKVHAVFHASLRLLELILVDFVPKHKLGKVETVHAVSRTLPNLIQKTGETAARSRNAAIEFIDRMSEFAMVHQYQLVAQQATPPFKRDMAMRLALSRVEILERLFTKFGLEPPVLTVETGMKFASQALSHSSGSVRDAATRIIFLLYKIAGNAVKAYLPPDDNTTRKNPLYRNIFDGFDRISGKLTQSELKAQQQAKAAESERKKKQEIEDLQSQVNQLRQMNNMVANEQVQQPAVGKKSKKSTTKPPPPPAEEASPNKAGDENDSTYLENMCIFCGERDDAFTEEGLDLHYWKHCPLLKKCEHCKQVVEVAGYCGHLLTECDKKSEFGECPRCKEAIPLTDLDKHVADKRCTAAKPGLDHCPLCHKNIALGEESWKSHLMGVKRDACLENPRRQPSINRLRAKEESEKAAAAGKGKKSGVGNVKKQQRR